MNCTMITHAITQGCRNHAKAKRKSMQESDYSYLSHALFVLMVTHSSRGGEDHTYSQRDG